MLQVPETAYWQAPVIVSQLSFVQAL